ncbi:piggyBac transposable element-derived protein 4-like [Aricia agestis]|uniref:piggyBac transposable element-derived protein 4-like n=1 Tax=Aricia agestis TaxID=91739 RepID=UPI001C201DA4|nr:piggyBac transposable element-derived protein 4-like [Aricia agestis]XP_041979521.1 piggyBac transposable element-derived protein 4-like [Aricia agestis]
MSIWRADQNPPTDLLELLYEDEVKIFDEDLEDEDDPMIPSRAVSRERSRPPLSSISATVPADAVVLRTFDKFGVPLDERATGDEVLAPDTHLLYASTGERERDERNRRRGTSERRGCRREVRRVRGQSARGGGVPNRGHRRPWALGHPLHEIWLDDDDVPAELLSLAMDVVRSRQRRLQDEAVVDSTERGRVASESENELEFFDASDGADALYSVERQNLDFEWSPMEIFQGREQNFQPDRTGSVRVFNSAYDAFRSYWSEEVLGLIVAETNVTASKISSAAFQAEWYPTNMHEILCLFSFWMMLGIVKMPTIFSCFSVDPLLKTEVFRRIFTRKRYEMLNRALNFEDSDLVIDNQNPSNTGASFDRLHRLKPILEHLNAAFQSHYILSKDICINESPTLWKGRSNSNQCIRTKATIFGIKTFELCESTTGYLWSFIVHTFEQSATDLEHSPGELESTAVVKKLIDPLLNKGYRLFMDNWYNSPLLARFLKLNGTDFVGTLGSSRRDVPILINKAPLKRGEYIARHSSDVTVLSWQDKKRVTMISTCHGSSTALPTVSSRLPSSRKVRLEPQVVLDFNKFMGGVDVKDQMLEPYLLDRKHSKKWCMKLFKRFLSVSILNSRILLQSSTQKNFDDIVFRLELVDHILIKHLSHCPQPST